MAFHSRSLSERLYSYFILLLFWGMATYYWLLLLIKPDSCHRFECPLKREISERWISFFFSKVEIEAKIKEVGCGVVWEGCKEKGKNLEQHRWLFGRLKGLELQSSGGSRHSELEDQDKYNPPLSHQDSQEKGEQLSYSKSSGILVNFMWLLTGLLKVIIMLINITSVLSRQKPNHDKSNLLVSAILCSFPKGTMFSPKYQISLKNNKQNQKEEKNKTLHLI